jgi:sec-independent protein translocase protein TatA
MQWWHWLIIVAAFVLLFGAKRLPDAARGVGRSLRILKSEVGAMSSDDTNASGTPTPTAAAPVQIANPQPPVQPVVQAPPVQAQPVVQAQPTTAEHRAG